MSKIQDIFYKSLELKRESPLHVRPVAYQIKDAYRDVESDDEERDMGAHMLKYDMLKSG